MERKKSIRRQPRGNQKLKILYLMKIFLDETDEDHDITLAGITEKLKNYGITAERKSIYDDIENLRLYGLDIIRIQYDHTYHYKVANRHFELAELKLLVDCVQSAKFITTKKSNELIKKIESFASRHEAYQLHRQVCVAGRVKMMNENIYYNVDAIHEALSSNLQIKFQYFSWNVNKEAELKREGAFYQVSPWALCWDDEKYYLVAYDEDEKIMKHFRVDKMQKVSVENLRRKGRAAFSEFGISEYTNRLFGMFDGEQTTVKLLCENAAANVMIDRFGHDVPIYKTDSEHFEISVKVSVSRLFLGWIMALQGVEIIAPESVVEQMKAMLREQGERYGINKKHPQGML